MENAVFMQAKDPKLFAMYSSRGLNTVSARCTFTSQGLSSTPSGATRPRGGECKVKVLWKSVGDPLRCSCPVRLTFALTSMVCAILPPSLSAVRDGSNSPIAELDSTCFGVSAVGADLVASLST